jgi:class 3 adenylate cyclase
LATLFLNTGGFGASITESRMLSQTDLRQILPTIDSPTLVIQRQDDEVNPATSSRYLAEHLPDAEYLEVPGRDGLPWIGDQEPILEAIERFMGVERVAPLSDRRLATVLFTDIVDSSARAAEMGDAAWGTLISDHHRVLRDHLATYGGAEIDTAGDGFFAAFEGPTQAVRCAVAAVHAVRGLGLAIRAGVHTGEVETIEGKPGGAAVVVGARVAAAAGPDEVLVSRTVKDLVAGSGLMFDDAGEHDLKGIPDRWHLFRVAT